MIRLYYRYFIVATVILFGFYAVFQSFPSENTSGGLQLSTVTCPTFETPANNREHPIITPAKSIVCSVDGHKSYSCLRDSEDVYFPFDQFLKKQFDISGKFLKGSGAEPDRFEWWTSYSKVRFPDEGDYDPTGPFGHFASYSVESRDRVRCISAQYGVPMSTQWSPKPYFYPIQIAQYALQHYSRNKTGEEPVIIEIGRKAAEWILDVPDDAESGIRQSYDEILESDVIEVISKGKDTGMRLQLNESTRLDVLTFLWRSDSSGTFTIVAEIVQSETIVHLHYVHRNDGRCVWHEGNGKEMIYYYELGAKPDPLEWRMVCRDVLVDVSRALVTVSSGRKSSNMAQLRPGDVRAVSLIFRGHSWVRDMKQRSSAHMERFLMAADWFFSNQDKHGGWPVPVERSIAEKRLTLPAGWYSAMAQGHALSVLTRAYSITNDLKYLRAASKATILFKINASEGGVRNELFGNAWYEEYPTQPGTFVLNGFMYALIGLHELSLMPKEFSGDGTKLFQEGMRTLMVLLPLFDTGSGSIYDLRHIGLKTAPNLARWDYHSVHIYLLKWLFNITKEKQLNETANRWAAYAQGKRAKHN